MHQGWDPKVNTDAEKGITRGALSGGSMLPQQILKISCPRLTKNTFAIQHLLHRSVIYTFIHCRTIFFWLEFFL